VIGGAAAGVDALGIHHPPAKAPIRIVSLVPSLTELLFALGLGPAVVGRSTFCVHPSPEIDAVPRIGGTKKPRLDRIRTLAPTHVVVNVDENRREDVSALRELGSEIIVTHPLRPSDNLDLYALLGHVFSRKAEAERLTELFSAELAATETVGRRLPSAPVLYLIWRAPWMTISEPTYISRMLALVNWQTLPLDPERRYPEIDLDDPRLEGVAEILLPSEPFPFGEKHARELAAIRPGIPIRLVDGEYLSWYGSRAIAGLRNLRTLRQPASPHRATASARTGVPGGRRLRVEER